MMIKITERCSMGCIHCLNDARPEGKEISLITWKHALEFMVKHRIGKILTITGGEPLMHGMFDALMDILLGVHKQNKRYFQIITVTTNGEKLLENPDKYKGLVDLFASKDIKLMFQVSTDPRYYPRRIDVNHPIFKEEGFLLVDNCVQHLYPQGRAVTKGLKCNKCTPKCFNVRSLAQLETFDHLHLIESMLAVNGRFCTPHIKMTGEFGLGESDLCPPCGSIYEEEWEIIQKIREFKCDGCPEAFANLPESLKEHIGQ